jgi:predicted nucleic acid-binding protein
MMLTVLVDAGPLTALLNPNDAWHAWAREARRRLPPPLLTSAPVLTEVSFLLRRERCDADGMTPGDAVRTEVHSTLSKFLNNPLSHHQIHEIHEKAERGQRPKTTARVLTVWQLFMSLQGASLQGPDGHLPLQQPLMGARRRG